MVDAPDEQAPRRASISHEELLALNDKYEPFSSFSTWLACDPRAAAWARYQSLLESRRQGLTDEDFERVREVVLRAAAIETGAIEGLYKTDRGFTLTVAYQVGNWQHVVETRGEATLDLFEAQLSGYHLALDLATGARPLSEAFIRGLHEAVCAPQATYRALTPEGFADLPFTKGEYKEHPNHVRERGESWHSYAPVDLTGAEMHRLVTELSTPEFQAAHPILQVAYAHYALVCVHPFADGNGRVARALASAYQLRATSLPFLVLEEQRTAYFDALSEVDQGNPQAFVDYTYGRAIDAVTLALDAMHPVGPPAAQSLAELQTLLMSHGGLGRREIDLLVIGLLEPLTVEFNTALASLPLPIGVTFAANTTRIGETPAIPDGYQLPAANAQWRAALVVQSPPPAEAVVRLYIAPMVAIDPDELVTFRLEDDVFGAVLEIPLEQVHPVPTEAFRARLASWADSLGGRMLDMLASQARDALNQSGYRLPD